jgi:hypothetical protein
VGPHWTSPPAPLALPSFADYRARKRRDNALRRQQTTAAFPPPLPDVPGAPLRTAGDISPAEIAAARETIRKNYLDTLLSASTRGAGLSLAGLVLLAIAFSLVLIRALTDA